MIWLPWPRRRHVLIHYDGMADDDSPLVVHYRAWSPLQLGDRVEVLRDGKVRRLKGRRTPGWFVGTVVGVPMDEPGYRPRPRKGSGSIRADRG